MDDQVKILIFSPETELGMSYLQKVCDLPDPAMNGKTHIGETSVLMDMIEDGSMEISGYNGGILIVRYMDIITLEKLRSICQSMNERGSFPYFIGIYRDPQQREFKISCPSCGQKLWVKDRDEGRRNLCPNCKKNFLLYSQVEHLRNELNLPRTISVIKFFQQNTATCKQMLKTLVQNIASPEAYPPKGNVRVISSPRKTNEPAVKSTPRKTKKVKVSSVRGLVRDTTERPVDSRTTQELDLASETGVMTDSSRRQIAARKTLRVSRDQIQNDAEETVDQPANPANLQGAPRIIKPGANVAAKGQGTIRITPSMKKESGGDTVMNRASRAASDTNIEGVVTSFENEENVDDVHDVNEQTDVPVTMRVDMSGMSPKMAMPRIQTPRIIDLDEDEEDECYEEPERKTIRVSTKNLHKTSDDEKDVTEPEDDAEGTEEKQPIDVAPDEQDESVQEPADEEAEQEAPAEDEEEALGEQEAEDAEVAHRSRIHEYIEPTFGADIDLNLERANLVAAVAEAIMPGAPQTPRQAAPSAPAENQKPESEEDVEVEEVVAQVVPKVKPKGTIRLSPGKVKVVKPMVRPVEDEDEVEDEAEDVPLITARPKPKGTILLSPKQAVAHRPVPLLESDDVDDDDEDMEVLRASTPKPVGTIKLSAEAAMRSVKAIDDDADMNDEDMEDEEEIIDLTAEPIRENEQPPEPEPEPAEEAAPTFGQETLADVPPPTLRAPGAKVKKTIKLSKITAKVRAKPSVNRSTIKTEVANAHMVEDAVEEERVEPKSNVIPARKVKGTIRITKPAGPRVRDTVVDEVPPSEPDEPEPVEEEIPEPEADEYPAEPTIKRGFDIEADEEEALESELELETEPEEDPEPQPVKKVVKTKTFGKTFGTKKKIVIRRKPM